LLHGGDVFYTPIHREWYYEVVVTDIQVNNVSLDMDCKEVSGVKGQGRRTLV